MDNLAERVNSCVGSARARELERTFDPEYSRDSAAQLSCDGDLAWLIGEPLVTSAVVRDAEAPSGDAVWIDESRPGRIGQTSSMRAMGALSPGRGPSFKILV